jgi:hypothetical protein
VLRGDRHWASRPSGKVGAEMKYSGVIETVRTGLRTVIGSGYEENGGTNLGTNTRAINNCRNS